MYKYLILLILLLIENTSHAQAPTFNEIFRQKRTARRYMARQIAELQLYIELTKKGYDLVNDGLELVHGFTNGEFNLHQLFYTSLKLVSPEIKKYPNLKTIINQQIYIHQLLKDLKTELNKNNSFTPSQTKHILSTLANLKTDTDELTDQLHKILSDNKLELSDDQRLEEINKLLSRSTNQLQFIQQLSAETLFLIHSTTAEQTQTQTLKQLYYIK